MTTATTSGRAVDAGTLRALQLSYAQLVKAGGNSVRAAWRFGQTLDSFSDAYTQLQVADAMNLSVSTIARYLRLFHAYQRPELALEASAQLETFNIDILVALHDHLAPVGHGRPLAGRHWISTCRTCGSHDVGRDEIPPEDDEDEENKADGPVSGK
jgi:transcriptional regulator with XRE-family HTH domain